MRDYFPNGTDLRVYSPDDLRRVADELNNRPHRTLEWRTPAELFATLHDTFV